EAMALRQTNVSSNRFIVDLRVKDAESVPSVIIAVASRSRGHPRSRLQPYIFILERLALDARGRRRDPIGNFARLGDRVHQTAHVFAILNSGKPVILTRFKFVTREQVTFQIEVMTGVFAYVTMKANVG